MQAPGPWRGKRVQMLAISRLQTSLDPREEVFPGCEGMWVNISQNTSGPEADSFCSPFFHLPIGGHCCTWPQRPLLTREGGARIVTVQLMRNHLLGITRF